MAGQRSRGGRERGADLRYNMEITLEEAFQGKTAQIEIPVSVTCESCSGTGAKAGTKPKNCSTCGGAGRVRQAQGFFTLERTCPGCQGRGQMIDVSGAEAVMRYLEYSVLLYHTAKQVRGRTGLYERAVFPYTFVRVKDGFGFIAGYTAM